MLLSLAFSPASPGSRLPLYESPVSHKQVEGGAVAQAHGAQAQVADNSDFIAFLPQAREDQFPREKILTWL